MSSVIACLLRDMVFHQSGTSPLCGGHSRIGSGLPGFSTLITSAPKSASREPTNGPASMEPSSRTRSPASAPGDAEGSANVEPMLLRIVGIDHELMEAREMGGSRDFRH